MSGSTIETDRGALSLKPLRIGVIGAGRNTRSKHIPLLRQIPGVTIAAVCNRSPESSRRVAAELDIPVAAADWEAIVADPAIDAVVIGTWPHLHAEATLAALAAGKHVLTEARMAASLEESERMLAASLAHPELVAQVVPGPMSLAFDEVIVDLLQRGILGTLREVCATNTSDQFASARTPVTPRQVQTANGINMITMGIYVECVQRWLAGELTITAADAAVFTRQRPDADGELREVTVPESVTALGRLPGGTRVVLHFSGVERGSPRNEFRLNGANASLRLDVGRQELWLTEEGKTEVLLDVPAERRRGWRVERDFVESIRGGAAVRFTTFPDGVRYMQVTDAVARAIAA